MYKGLPSLGSRTGSSFARLYWSRRSATGVLGLSRGGQRLPQFLLPQAVGFTLVEVSGALRRGSRSDP